MDTPTEETNDKPKAPKAKHKDGFWAPRVTVALSAAFISLCSLAVSVYQMRLTRAQHYASVWPNLVLYWSSQQTDSTFTQSVRLMNQGIGPAVVRRTEVWYNGRPYAQMSDAVERFFADEGRPQWARASSNRNILLPGWSIVPGQEWVWFELTHPAAAAYYAERLDRFSVRVHFASVYGQEWVSSLNVDARTDMVPQRRR